MKNLAILIGFAAAFLLVLGLSTGDAQTIGLASVGVALAVTTWLSARMSRFLMIFAAIFGAEFIIFGSVYMLDANAFWPAALAEHFRNPAPELAQETLDAGQWQDALAQNAARW